MNIDKEMLKINELEAELEFVKQNIRDKNELIERLSNDAKGLSTENTELKKELDSIKYSRSYKLIQKIKRILRRK